MITATPTPRKKMDFYFTLKGRNFVDLSSTSIDLKTFPR